MNDLQQPGEGDFMLEVLLRRQDYLKLIIDSHLRWLRVAEDEQVKAMHRALVDSLTVVARQYHVLLDALQETR